VLNENERHPTEEPVWLTAECDDPDPSVRLQAIETWGREPEETLDPLTYALVDPDESVRARAQELLEKELARR
jgi:HEAT repeat protein